MNENKTYRFSMEEAAAMIRRFTPTYRLVQELGQGTYGQVFLVEDELKSVAVKLIPLDYRRKNAPEIGYDWQRLTVGLHHPALVRIHDFFRDSDLEGEVRSCGLIYMDYWPTNLRRFVRRLHKESRHTTAHKFLLLLRLAELLHRLREDAGLLVTDLKLSNVLVRESGSGRQNAISLAMGDLGGVQRVGCAAVPRVETTDAYWAPEVHDGSQVEIDELALIYSFGLVAYFVLEGREPHHNRGLDEAMALKIRKHGPPPWATAGDAGVAALQAIATRCMAPDRADRYRSFAELSAVLRETWAQWMRRSPLVFAAQAEDWREPLTQMPFRRIPAGRYAMGQGDAEREALLKSYNADRYDSLFSRELPLHEVSLTEFWMASAQVTRAQFAQFVDETLYCTDAEREGWSYGMSGTIWTERQGIDWRKPGFPQSGEHPVVCVSWFDAAAFAAWLSQRTGLRFALPSEAQWEYACRAGTTSAFHCGEAISTALANYDGRQIFGDGKPGPFRARTTPVGRYPANAFGLHDMHGNVWEWCSDRLDPDFYASDEARKEDPLCLRETGVRARRGGSWSHGPAFLRAAYRGKNYPDARYSDLGFRLILLP